MCFGIYVTLYCWHGCTRSIMVSNSEKLASCFQISAEFISFIEKGMNPFLLFTAMGKIAGVTELFLPWGGLGERIPWIKNHCEKKSAPSGYLAIGTLLLLWLEYMWCPYDLYKLWDSWHNGAEISFEHINHNLFLLNHVYESITIARKLSKQSSWCILYSEHMQNLWISYKVYFWLWNSYILVHRK